MNASPRIVPPPLPWTGGCQCGAVRYTVTMAPLTVYACHCTECQHQSSSAFAMSMRLPREGLTLEGETAVTVRDDGKVAAVEGVFCPRCGSRILHRRAGQKTLNLKPGTLDDASWISPVGHLWVRSAQAWLRSPPDGIVYPQQPPNYDELCEAWTRATADG